MVDWMLLVMTSYRYKDHALFKAVQLMDCYLANTTPRKLSQLHIIGVCSIFAALKSEEVYPIKLKTMQEKIAHHKLSASEIKAEEGALLECINFDVSSPSLYDLVSLIGGGDLAFTVARMALF